MRRQVLARIRDEDAGYGAECDVHPLNPGLPEAAELARLLVLCAEKVREGVGTLRSLKRPEQILAGCKEIRRLESLADETLRAGLGALYKSVVDPLTVIKWKEIYELLQTATGKCREAAHVVEGVVFTSA